MLFHPILVHFPIAFYFLELVLLLLWKGKKDPAYLRFALFSFRLAFGLMLVTMTAGWFDAHGWVKPVRRHGTVAFITAGCYTLHALLWKWEKTRLPSAILGNVLVAVTGFFGGELVYGD